MDKIVNKNINDLKSTEKQNSTKISCSFSDFLDSFKLGLLLVGIEIFCEVNLLKKMKATWLLGTF